MTDPARPPAAAQPPAPPTPTSGPEAAQHPPVGAPVAAAPVARPNGRRRGLLLVAGVSLAAALAYGVYWAVALRHFEHTDNAYVQGNLVQITPQVAGTVVAILADETDRVLAGQPLVRLDPADARLALQQAEAQLGQTVREVRTLYANNGALDAQIAVRNAELRRAQADIGRAQAEAARWQDDLARRVPLLASGAVGQEEVNHARTQLQSAQGLVASAQGAVAAAEAGLAAAREQLGSNQALTAGTAVADHPNVQRAAAQVREAWLATQRTELPAPVAGVVAKRNVQLGQRVAAGAPLMTVVSLDRLWVDANFKEAQLRQLRVGQPATLVADVYGDKVSYRGRVAGLGAGTGSAFALLPAQNATGNWIKVTQRVPVRITLDAQELAQHPLRVGLSMTVEVDVADGAGEPLAAAAPAAHTETAVFDTGLAAADARVQQVLAASMGQRARTAAPAAATAGKGR